MDTNKWDQFQYLKDKKGARILSLIKQLFFSYNCILDTVIISYQERWHALLFTRKSVKCFKMWVQFGR